MTKTLTEQWKNGELDYGYYYLQTKDGERRIDRTTCDIVSSIYLWTQTDKNYIQEVLAPVPSYSEFQALKDNCEFTHTRLKGTHQKIDQLEKKLEIATNALDEYKRCENGSYANKGLALIKEVK